MGPDGERCGALCVVCPDAKQAEHVLGQMKFAVRRNYSSPPIHGGQIVAQALTTDDELVVARCDLDWCRRYKDTLFDFDRYRRPEVYTRITAQRGAIPPP